VTQPRRAEGFTKFADDFLDEERRDGLYAREGGDRQVDGQARSVLGHDANLRRGLAREANDAQVEAGGGGAAAQPQNHALPDLRHLQLHLRAVRLLRHPAQHLAERRLQGHAQADARLQLRLNLQVEAHVARSELALRLVEALGRKRDALQHRRLGAQVQLQQLNLANPGGQLGAVAGLRKHGVEERRRSTGEKGDEDGRPESLQ